MGVFDWLVGKKKVVAHELTHAQPGRRHDVSSRGAAQPNKDDAERSGDWATLLKALSESKSQTEMTDLVQAIVRVGDRKAAHGLVTLVIQSYQSGAKAAEERKKLQQDPQALLMDRLRKQTDIFTVGYNPQRTASPINELNEVVGRHFIRGHRALDALIGLKATEEIQTLLDNPALKAYGDNFRSALKRIHEEDGAGSDLGSSTPKPIDEDTNSAQQSTSASTSETEKGREVTFVIPCGVCSYKTSVTVRIDWGGSILSGSTTDHEFQCHNCNKVFTVTKDSLKQCTDGFV